MSPVARSPFEARPGRRAVVAPDLAALAGPRGGVVELPNRLFWQPVRTVDLDAPIAAFQLSAARLALRAAAPYGFALARGQALIAHGARSYR